MGKEPAPGSRSNISSGLPVHLTVFTALDVFVFALQKLQSMNQCRTAGCSMQDSKYFEFLLYKTKSTPTVNTSSKRET